MRINNNVQYTVCQVCSSPIPPNEPCPYCYIKSKSQSHPQSARDQKLEICPECGEESVIRNGCRRCVSCGWEACG